MGADHRMYGGPWLDCSDHHYLDWPNDYVPSSIQDLAQHIAKTLDYIPDAIIGSSLGGMVALEMADFLQVRHVVLLGSAVTSNEINPILRAFGPLAQLTPFTLAKVLAGISSSLLSRMYAQQNPNFIKAMIPAALHWSYAGAAKIYRIHGIKDHVISCSNPNVRIRGGHLIAMTHAAECVSAIAKWRHRQVN